MLLCPKEKTFLFGHKGGCMFGCFHGYFDKCKDDHTQVDVMDVSLELYSGIII